MANNRVEGVRHSLVKTRNIAIVCAIGEITLATTGSLTRGASDGLIGFALGTGLMFGVIAVMSDGIRKRLRGSSN